jgi:hypothetical protein
MNGAWRKCRSSVRSDCSLPSAISLSPVYTLAFSFVLMQKRVRIHNGGFDKTVVSQKGVCIQFKKICPVMEMKGNNNLVFLSVTK